MAVAGTLGWKWLAQCMLFLGGRPSVGSDDDAPDFSSRPEAPPLADDDDIPFIANLDLSPDPRFNI